MGPFNLSEAKRGRRASIAEYSASLDTALDDDRLDEGRRKQLEPEKKSIDNMSEKEWKRRADFKRGQGKQDT